MVRIVTDTDCDLPVSLLTEHRITVLQTECELGGRKYKDIRDIGPDELFARLNLGQELKCTQPETEDIRRTFLELAAGGDAVVSIHLSHKYRNTAAIARKLAADMKGKAQIEVFDSLAVSLAQGLLVLRAALLAEGGAQLDHIRSVLANLIPRTHSLIAIDDIDFPMRQGRMNRLQYFLASATGMKPVVCLTADGVMGLAGRARSQEGALAEMLRLVDERLSYPQEQILGVIHTGRLGEAKALRAQLQAKYNPREIIIAEAGASTAMQTGPGSLGVAFFSDKTRE